jgi:hypothetical protein
MGRAWQPRPKFAGTYDQNWIDNIFPFLPADFDERYYQSAPPDQQIDFPNGGEAIVLLNLTPRGQTTFKLPTISVPVTFHLRNGERNVKTAVIDTIILEPDLERFMLVWRTSRILKQNAFEISRVEVGKFLPKKERTRENGKPYYSSLEELIDVRSRIL